MHVCMYVCMEWPGERGSNGCGRGCQQREREGQGSGGIVRNITAFVSIDGRKVQVCWLRPFYNNVLKFYCFSVIIIVITGLRRRI